MRRQAIKHRPQDFLIFFAQAAKHCLDLPRAIAFNAPDKPVPFGTQTHLLGPMIVIGDASLHQARLLQAVNHAADAGRADDQPLAKVSQSQGGTSLLLRPLQGPQDAPLGTAYTESRKVRLHHAAKQAVGLYQRPKGRLSRRRRSLSINS